MQADAAARWCARVGAHPRELDLAYISAHLPTSPHISQVQPREVGATADHDADGAYLALPISPYISPYLPISP